MKLLGSGTDGGAKILTVRSRGVTAGGEGKGGWDRVMVGALLVLAALGALMVYSVSTHRLATEGEDPSFTLRRHLVFLVVGIAIFIFASLMDLRALHTFSPLLYLASLLGLVAVLFLPAARGAQRWISIGAFQLQPSEFAKPALILLLAALLAPTGEHGPAWRRIGLTLGLVAIPGLLIFQQPDLGTSLVFGFVTVGMLFAAGTSLRRLTLVVALAVGAIALGSALGLIQLSDYQQRRLDAFLHPETASLDATYNQNQSLITIGSGELFGRGVLGGSQTNLSFVPEQTTDFIFTAVGEQLGFVGGSLVLLLYAVVVWRLLRAALAATDRFGSLVGVGAVTFILFHVFVNIGMTLGIMPVTGLPLPLMSHGGSSIAATALTLGIANAVSRTGSSLPARVRSIL